MTIWSTGTSDVGWVSWTSTTGDVERELKAWLDAGGETLYELEIPRLFPEMPDWLRRVAPGWLVRWWYD